jgi:hypothetical protein
MGVSLQCHAPPPERTPGSHWIGGWVGLRAGMYVQMSLSLSNDQHPQFHDNRLLVQCHLNPIPLILTYVLLIPLIPLRSKS